MTGTTGESGSATIRGQRRRMPITAATSVWTNRANAKFVSDGMGGTIYNIPYPNVGYNTGYINFGQEMNYVTIVVKDGTSTVWTAFPSFGDYGMKMTY